MRKIALKRAGLYTLSRNHYLLHVINILNVSVRMLMLPPEQPRHENISELLYAEELSPSGRTNTTTISMTLVRVGPVRSKVPARSRQG